jgi:hypothetical protein
MVSGLSTSPYDQDMIVWGEARLIRSAVNPLVSTGFSPKKKYDSFVSAKRVADANTRDKQRQALESISQALAVLCSFFTSNRDDYMHSGMPRQGC